MKNKQLNHQQFKSGSKTYPICVLAHDIESPLNVGSLFRIADALGVEKIYLSGRSPQPPNRKIKKTARSTENYVAYSYSETAQEIIHPLKAQGYTFVSLEITSASTDIRDFSVSAIEKLCLITGSESTGVDQQLLELSDYTVHIPMCGQNSSMNLATACAIAVFEIAGKLTESERQVLA